MFLPACCLSLIFVSWWLHGAQLRWCHWGRELREGFDGVPSWVFTRGRDFPWRGTLGFPVHPCLTKPGWPWILAVQFCEVLQCEKLQHFDTLRLYLSRIPVSWMAKVDSSLFMWRRWKPLLRRWSEGPRWSKTFGEFNEIQNVISVIVTSFSSSF